VISLIGVLHGPDELEITSVFRLDAESAVPGGRTLDLRAELVGAEGRVVASGNVYALHSQADCGCGGESAGGGEQDSYPRLVQAFVPDVEAGALLRIQRGEKEMWSRSAPTRRPKLTEAAATLAGDDVKLGWSVESAGEQEPECWAQWSTDRGRTWHALAAGLRGGSAVVDARGLPGGRVSVRLLVSDGFHTAVSKLLPVTVPRRPPNAAILSPRDGQTFVANSPMRLWGTAGQGEPPADDAARWLVDGKEVARGLDAFVEAPKAGKHRATLAVKTGDGSTEISVSFVTVGVPEERDED
jgi:hypothetical protein